MGKTSAITALNFVGNSLALALFFAVLPLECLKAEEAPELEEASLAQANSLSKAFQYAAKKITPSVVNISTSKRIVRSNQAPPGLNDPFFEQFKDFLGEDFFERFKRGNPRGRMQQGLGTGVILEKSGLIVTNNHVIGDADQVEVRFQGDSKSYEAKIVGTDPQSDLALIRVDSSGKDLVAAMFGDSDKLEIGEWVVAAGNPFNLDNSITAGIVSAKGRTQIVPGQYEDFIQTDAAINPGNSGGPLVNLRGEVIGINTAIFSRSGGYMGIGFAIPSKMVESVVKSLEERGKVIRGWLGVAIQNLTPDLAQSFKFSGTDGALVGEVQPDGPGAKAGIKQGDIILKFNGVKVTNVNELRNRVAATPPNTAVDVTVFRDGKEEVISTSIGELPSKPENSFSSLSPEDGESGSSAESRIGVRLETLTKELASRLGLEATAGAVVAQVIPGSLAEEVGLRVKDVVVQVNGVKINSAEQVDKMITEGALKKGVRLLVDSGGMERFVFLKES
jgi:serine protease Do